MSSIIKVDTIQTAAGGVPTAGDLGLNVTGTVLQVVSAEYSTANTTTTSSTYTDTGLSCSITPTSTSSKILTTVFAVGLYKSVADTAVALRLTDGTTAYEFETLAAYNASSNVNAAGGSGYQKIWTPSSTSTQTYTLQFATPAGVGSAWLNARYSSTFGGTRSTMVVMEIAG